MLLALQVHGAAAWAYQSAENYNNLLGNGINLGNALEAPAEGEWGVTLQPGYFKVIKDAGFKHVRIPIRWSAHAQVEAPFAIDATFFDRVDWAVNQAVDQSMPVIINMHHYDLLENAPVKQRARFVALWQQIAHHFKDAPDTVAFEIYNEPAKAMDEATWTDLYTAALNVIRAENAHRIVIVGPVKWNSINSLPSLKLPENDPELIATIHYYEPFHFTHQNASWVGSESKNWRGTQWTDSVAEREQVSSDLEKARDWGQKNKRQIYLGEFGAYSGADMASRARWTAAVQEEANRRGFATAYWEFCSGFGAYDPVSNAWREPLLKALVKH